MKRIAEMLEGNFHLAFPLSLFSAWHFSRKFSCFSFLIHRETEPHPFVIGTASVCKRNRIYLLTVEVPFYGGLLSGKNPSF
jgi:hypothetical protein